jgi:hypothetical protein
VLALSLSKSGDPSDIEKVTCLIGLGSLNHNLQRQKLEKGLNMDEFIEADYEPEFGEFVYSSQSILDDLLASLENKTVDAQEIRESLLTLKQLVDCMDFMHSETTQGTGAA